MSEAIIYVCRRDYIRHGLLKLQGTLRCGMLALKDTLSSRLLDSSVPYTADSGTAQERKFPVSTRNAGRCGFVHGVPGVILLLRYC